MEQLEQHFDTAFAAPNGIKKLRALILTLAMQGKLVPQDANDQSASELLKEIEVEKQRLVKEGRIKTPKQLPEVKSEEIPYELPMGWEWVRIRDICHDWGQKTPDEVFTYIDVGSINNKYGVISEAVQVLNSSEAPSRARKIVQKGSVIYSTVRPYLLNIAIIEKEYPHEPIASTAFAILHPYAGVSNYFIYHFLRSPVFVRFVETVMKGVAYPAINDGDFFQGFFPLPPFAEQQRIVAKIDQLMACCDEMEKLRAERERMRVGIHTASLKRLLDTQKSDTFAEAKKFITHHFGELYSVKANVTELRKAILQLAVMGKLVPQDPNDPPASELLKEIEAEKRQLVKEGKIKNPKPLPEIKREEEPFELPQGWAWVRFGEIAHQITDGAHHTPIYVSEGVPFLSVKDMSTGQLDFSDTRFITQEQHEDLIKRCYPQKGDLLLTKVGTTGIPVLIETEQEFSIFVSVALVKFAQHLLSGHYLSWLVKSPLVKKQSDDGTEGVGNKNLVLRKIANFYMAIPPLPEQHRIVAKIDQLMALCDMLEQQIDAATCKQTALLNAVMAQV
jgi:type I restriction enzyme S subunit